MAIITTGKTFGTTDPVTSVDLNNVANAATFNDPVDETSLELITAGTNIGKLQIKDAGVTTDKIADSSSKTTGVTLAKMQHISTAKVLGRASASEGDVEEVDVVIGASGDAGVLFDNDDMLDNSDTAGGSATRGATQQSIKAYVDASSTDGFAPPSYDGGESVTFPNGLIMKWGEFTPSIDGTNTVSYGVDFPTETVNVQYSRFKSTHSGYDENGSVNSKSEGGFTIHVTNASAYGKVMWQAIGR